MSGVVQVEDADGNVEEKPTDRMLHLRNRVGQLTTECSELRRQIGRQQELAEEVAAAVNVAEPQPKFLYTKAQKQGTPMVPALKLSDWHIGEVVNPGEIENINSYNLEIARQRMFHIISSFLNWVEVQRKFYVIEECVLLCEGDYISGDIHQELMVTNEFPLPVQTAHAGYLLGEVIRRVAGHFKRVKVVLVGADNHGRLQKKPQGKQKSANNMSYLVHTIAQTYVQKSHNLRFEVAEAMKHLTTVGGWKFLVEHGDTVKGWAGFPYYGMGRVVGREARRRMNTDRGFHYWSIGHFHVPCVIEGNMLVNGSLSGTSEFDHSVARQAAPSQVAFMMHPKHGMFNWTPFLGR
jgi:hypothetical protein